MASQIAPVAVTPEARARELFDRHGLSPLWERAANELVDAFDHEREMAGTVAYGGGRGRLDSMERAEREDRRRRTREAAVECALGCLEVLFAEDEL